MAKPSTFSTSKTAAAASKLSAKSALAKAASEKPADPELASQEEGHDAPASASKLAQSQARRLRRVLDAAGQLADQGGFEGVRLRDVAEASGVALGTLYRYFDSKEAILIHTIAEDLTALEERFCKEPIRGATALERVTEFFELLTRHQMLRPHYVRAAVRAISFAGGETHALPQVAAFHLRMISMILAALRGEAPRPHTEFVQEKSDANPKESAFCVEREQAEVLELIWFGLLVTWAGNLCEIERIVQKMRTAAQLILNERTAPTEKGAAAPEGAA